MWLPDVLHTTQIKKKRQRATLNASKKDRERLEDEVRVPGNTKLNPLATVSKSKDKS